MLSSRANLHRSLEPSNKLRCIESAYRAHWFHIERPLRRIDDLNSLGIVRVSTKMAVSLICVAGALFAFSPLIASFATLGLLTYAARREQTTDDKSERISSTAAALIFCGIGLWVVFCFYRALHQ